MIHFILEKTGAGLVKNILEKISSEGLDIKNCRGQLYYNGANVAVQYKGVKARISEKNGLTDRWVKLEALNLKVKGHPDTRWPSKYQPIRSLKSQLAEIYEILTTIVTEREKKFTHEYVSIAQGLN